ncbi:MULTISPECIES: DUF1045 domain-containing protein [unclassified Marinovum]
MSDRYALYYTIPPGPLAEALADWLGWDPVSGQSRVAPDVPGLPRAPEALTERPRKYGPHGTLKPPFHLTPGMEATALESAVQAFALGRGPVVLEGLELRRIGRFLALTALGDTAALRDFAADVVQHFDGFRAPPTPEELARRRKARLSSDQERNLQRWGYPHVMESFKFHITLTGPLKEDEIAATHAALTAHFAPLLPAPFTVDALSLLGSDADTGRFHLIRRAALGG